MKGSNDKVLSNIVKRALSGEGAHAGMRNAFVGLDWKVAAMRPAVVPHSIFQLLAHITYWQNWVLDWLDGKGPPIPRHPTGSWPSSAGPVSPAEWKRAVRNFYQSLDKLQRRSGKGDLLGTIGNTSRLRMLHTIASHTSYHIGQVVTMRQIFGKWPPPPGGLTW